jgi:hypothetical protein
MSLLNSSFTYCIIFLYLLLFHLDVCIFEFIQLFLWFLELLIHILFDFIDLFLHVLFKLIFKIFCYCCIEGTMWHLRKFLQCIIVDMISVFLLNCLIILIIIILSLEIDVSSPSLSIRSLVVWLLTFWEVIIPWLFLYLLLLFWVLLINHFDYLVGCFSHQKSLSWLNFCVVLGLVIGYIIVSFLSTDLGI